MATPVGPNSTSAQQQDLMQLEFYAQVEPNFPIPQQTHAYIPSQVSVEQVFNSLQIQIQTLTRENQELKRKQELLEQNVVGLTASVSQMTELLLRLTGGMPGSQETAVPLSGRVSQQPRQTTQAKLEQIPTYPPNIDRSEHAPFPQRTESNPPRPAVYSSTQTTAYPAPSDRPGYVIPIILRQTGTPQSEVKETGDPMN